jgi:hypothetical protein
MLGARTRTRGHLRWLACPPPAQLSPVGLWEAPQSAAPVDGTETWHLQRIIRLREGHCQESCQVQEHHHHHHHSSSRTRHRAAQLKIWRFQRVPATSASLACANRSVLPAEVTAASDMVDGRSEAATEPQPRVGAAPYVMSGWYFGIRGRPPRQQQPSCRRRGPNGWKAATTDRPVQNAGGSPGGQRRPL